MKFDLLLNALGHWDVASLRLSFFTLLFEAKWHELWSLFIVDISYLLSVHVFEVVWCSFHVAGEPEAHRLHERLLPTAMWWLLLFHNENLNRLGSQMREKEKKKINKPWQWQIFNHNVFCGLCYYHNFYIDHFCLLLLPIRVILLLSIWKLVNDNSKQPWHENSGLSKQFARFLFWPFWKLWGNGMFKIEFYFSWTSYCGAAI